MALVSVQEGRLNFHTRERPSRRCAHYLLVSERFFAVGPEGLCLVVTTRSLFRNFSVFSSARPSPILPPGGQALSSRFRVHASDEMIIPPLTTFVFLVFNFIFVNFNFDGVFFFFFYDNRGVTASSGVIRRRVSSALFVRYVPMYAPHRNYNNTMPPGTNKT